MAYNRYIDVFLPKLLVYIKKSSSIVQKYYLTYLNLENYRKFLPPSSCNYPVV